MSRKAIVASRALWFRSCDLRLDDHPALHAACRDATSLLPLYVFDPSCFNTTTRYGGARKSTARRARFLLECVSALRRRLEARGSGLAVGLGNPSEIVPRFATLCETVHVTEGFCSEEKKEEALAAKNLKQGELKRVWGGTLFFPNELGNNPDNIPLGHMQFRSNCRSKGRIRDPLPEPTHLPSLPADMTASEEVSKALEFLPCLEDLGYSADEAQAAHVDDPRGALVWVGGEDAAWARLQKWMFDNDHLKDYRDIQNGMVGEAYSSKLSPWIARGCISVRRIRQEAMRYESERMIKNFSTYWLPNMLEWRDFMIYIARSQGDRIFKLGGIIGDKAPWHGTAADLEAWKDGRTGEGIVDAAMKELLLTGYMSMRARHIVATYLIYDLAVDWRLGAAHFEEHLLDYDPALNWVMWMQAPGLLGRGGRHQGLLHFSVKKAVASQRKQLSSHAPDRAFVKLWLAGSSPVQTKSFYGAALPERTVISQEGSVSIKSGNPSRKTAQDIGSDDNDDKTTKTKRWARAEESNAHVCADVSVDVPANDKKCEGAYKNSHVASTAPNKRRWSRKDASPSYQLSA